MFNTYTCITGETWFGSCKGNNTATFKYMFRTVEPPNSLGRELGSETYFCTPSSRLRKLSEEVEIHENEIGLLEFCLCGIVAKVRYEKTEVEEDV